MYDVSDESRIISFFKRVKSVMYLIYGDVNGEYTTWGQDVDLTGFTKQYNTLYKK